MAKPPADHLCIYLIIVTPSEHHVHLIIGAAKPSPFFRIPPTPATVVVIPSQGRLVDLVVTGTRSCSACPSPLPSNIYLPICLCVLIFLFAINVLAQDLPRSPVIFKFC